MKIDQERNRRNAEEALRLLVEVTKAASEAKTVTEMMFSCLKALCQLKRWPIGQAWRHKPGTGVLECVPDAFYAEVEFHEFRAASVATPLARGVGLPGRVWQDKAPAWVSDVTRDSNFPRMSSAKSQGLKAAFAFPIESDDEVSIVFEFFSRDALDPDGYFLEALDKLGSHLGIVLARLCADEDRAHLFLKEQAARAEAEAVNGRLAFLAEAGALLSASLDYPGTLASIARLLVPYLADCCVIDVLTDGGLKRVEMVHRDLRQKPLLEQLQAFLSGTTNPITAAMSLGEAQFLPAITPELLQKIAADETHLRLLKNLHLRSMINVPLTARARRLGVMSVAMTESNRNYDEQDLVLLKEIARRAAVAIDNAELYRIAQKATQQREEFLAMISHDLRNPLSNIQLNLDLVREWLSVHPGARSTLRALDGISRATSRMASLVNNLLESARLSNGILVCNKGEWDLAELVDDSVAGMTALVEQKAIQLTQNIPSDLPRICVDKEQILQVLCNLLGNAIKFTPYEGRIEVAALLQDSAIRVAVKDNGPGIPQENKAHLFDRYWQAQKRDRRGVGLGLGIVKQLVEANAGRVEVDSVVGQGSSFYFTVPIASATGEPTGAPV